MSRRPSFWSGNGKAKTVYQREGMFGLVLLWLLVVDAFTKRRSPLYCFEGFGEVALDVLRCWQELVLQCWCFGLELIYLILVLWCLVWFISNVCYFGTDSISKENYKKKKTKINWQIEQEQKWFRVGGVSVHGVIIIAELCYTGYVSVGQIFIMFCTG